MYLVLFCHILCASCVGFIEGISICILPMVHVRNVTYIFQKCNIENGGVHVMNAGTTWENVSYIFYVLVLRLYN